MISVRPAIDSDSDSDETDVTEDYWSEEEELLKVEPRSLTEK